MLLVSAPPSPPPTLSLPSPPQTSWLDGKHVVFGRVVDGGSVLDEVERVDTGGGSHPVTPLVIAACGVVEE